MSGALALAALLQLQAPLAARADTVQLTHDALHYDIALIVSDSGNHILGEVETTWVLGSDAAVVVPLDSAMRVIRVLIDGRENTRLYRTRYGREGSIVYIPHEKQRGDTLKTRIRYRGTPRDGLIFGTAADGSRTVFADNWPDRAHLWLPVQDHPSDKATVSFRVEAAGDLQVIANGTLVGIDSLPYGHRAWRYRFDRPLSPYNFVIGVGRQAVTPLGEGGCAVKCVPTTAWAQPADSAFAAERFRKAPAMLDFFTQLVGEFPYGSLAHVQSTTAFGGMENATAIFYDTKAYQRRDLGETIIAHETAHQWFGDAVTEADWHHLWLSEGFATYLAALWVRHDQGEEAFRALMAKEKAEIVASKATERPIIDPEASNLMGLLSTNNYNKGAWVLHELRGLVGDSAFARTLRAFYARHRDGTALSADFAALASAEAGTNLDWFFAQALTLPGYPILEVAAARKGKDLAITLTQVQPDAWGLRRLPGLVLDVAGQRVRTDVTGRVTTLVVKNARGNDVTVDPDARFLLVTR